VTEDELERIDELGRAAGRRAAAEHPLSPAQRDLMNAIFRDAIRAVNREHEEESP
jgi:hypothetical protein